MIENIVENINFDTEEALREQGVGMFIGSVTELPYQKKHQEGIYFGWEDYK